jgi:hypothetical protein
MTLPGFRWFLRMSRWARNPPPARRVILVLAVIAACFVLYGFEKIWGWPDWLTVNRIGR